MSGLLYNEKEIQIFDRNVTFISSCEARKCMFLEMSLFTQKFRYSLCFFQLCYIMTAITICVRVDVYSVLYAVFLGLLMILSRHANAIVWPVWTIILVILLPIQFILCLGLPLFLCYGEFVFNFLPASGNSCCLLITFANSSDTKCQS